MDSLKRKLSSSSSSDDEREINAFEHGFSIQSTTINGNNIDFAESKPEQEYQLSKLIGNFHKKYQEKFTTLFHMRFAPKDSLNRFLYEQLSLPKSKQTSTSKASEINIPKPENIINLYTIDKEIKTAYPFTCCTKSFKEKKWKIQKNIKDCLYIGSNFSSKNRIIASNFNLKNLLNNGNKFTSANKYFDIFNRERKQYFAYFKVSFEQSIKDFKNFLLQELTNLIKKMDTSISINNTNKVVVSNDEHLVYIKYGVDSEFKVNKYHYDKIKRLFELNIEAHKEKSFKQTFEEYFYCMICRYQTFFSNNEQFNEGYGMQAALPQRVLKELHETFGVTQEMFASPFNCYFKNYCSAFLDTDFYFGSNGSFFDFEPSEGSFECNPPFTEEVIERMADRIDYLLGKTKSPLSFIVFIPEWLVPPTPGLVKMENSVYNRKHFNAENGNHQYISGSQHLSVKSKNDLYKSVHNTRIFFLQNDQGFSCWPPSEQNIQILKIAIHI